MEKKKPGRPFEYQTDEERPVTVSLRIPKDLHDRMEQYRSIHKQSVTELLLDGLRLRLETPADPRDIILSDDNTVMQELQEMVDAAVQAAMGQVSGTMIPSFDTHKTALHELAKPAHLLDDGIPFDEDLPPAPEAPVEPVPELSHNGNAVIQQEAPRRPGRQSTLRQPIVDLLREHREGLSAVQIKVHLGIDKNIGDTLAGMVRDHVIEKQGSGNAVRYLAVGAQPQDTRERSQPKRRATSKAGVR